MNDKDNNMEHMRIYIVGRGDSEEQTIDAICLLSKYWIPISQTVTYELICMSGTGDSATFDTVTTKTNKVIVPSVLHRDLHACALNGWLA